MTRRADVSDDHWTSLVRTGPAIARAVSHAAGSAGQSEAELDAYVREVSDAAAAHDRTTLLGELILDVSTALATGIAAAPEDPYTAGLEEARRAGAILAVAVEPEEADAIRAWYRDGARAVALARREGGFLGVGGEEVSSWERDALAEIADGLGVTPSR
jgi:hypothetical protein